MKKTRRTILCMIVSMVLCFATLTSCVAYAPTDEKQTEIKTQVKHTVDDESKATTTQSHLYETKPINSQTASVATEAATNSATTSITTEAATTSATTSITTSTNQDVIVESTSSDKKATPTVIYGKSYYKIYFIYEEDGKVVNDSSARGVLDNLSATAKVMSDGTCDIELILKGEMEYVKYTKSMLCFYLYIYNAEGTLVNPRTLITTSRYEKGDAISLYKTIRDLPYSESYKIELRSY